VLAGMGFISRDVARKHLSGKVITNDWQLNEINKMSPYKTNEDIVLNGYFTR
jgi:hypothetical protein